MSDHLLVAVLGNRNSGKSITWTRLFDATVRTGKRERQFYLNCAQWVSVFLINGSPEERETHVADIIPEELPQMVFCSTQYHEDVTETFDHFFEEGYDVFVQWLNPGYSDSDEYEDGYKLIDYLLNNGATVQIRNGQDDPSERIKEIRQFVLGWATHRGLIYTDFPT